MSNVPVSGYARRTKPEPSSRFLFWFIFLPPGFASISFFEGAVALGSALLGIFVVGIVLVQVFYAAPTRRWLARNEADYVLAQRVESVIAAYRPTQSLESLAARGLPRFADLRVGELSRHFDSETNSTISGWLSHSLGFRGWGLGGRAGGLGLGLGKLGLVGTSELEASMSGTTRDNLTGDGFLAVLEYPDRTFETMRVVALSEPAVRELLSGWVGVIGKLVGEESHTDTALGGIVQGQVLATDASHVSDILAAALRAPEAERPSVTVVGPRIHEYTVLGVGIQFENSDRVYSLFPIELVEAVDEAVMGFLGPTGVAPTPPEMGK